MQPAMAPVTLFLCGDVMTGRGIDQILPHPSDPELHESFVHDARDYVALAERVNGPIRRPVSYEYVWGDALGELTRAAPDVRIINLETSITTSDDWANDGWSYKEVLYRMHPDNVGCLSAAAIDCCTLANNHVLDCGERGLEETLACLQRAAIASAGAGRNWEAASAPALLEVPNKGRVIVVSFGTESSGIPPEWGATDERPGVYFIDTLGASAVDEIAQRIAPLKRPGDIAVASIHWGPNWGYAIADEQRRFAHALIDRAAIDIVHGHSSHHPLGIEVYADRLILYGAGDFVNDYEGIGSHPEFRGEHALMYFATVASHGRLAALRMVPMTLRRLSLQRASAEDARWLCSVLDRESRVLGSGVELGPDLRLSLRWDGAPASGSPAVGG